jgi:hypothetical protein
METGLIILRGRNLNKELSFCETKYRQAEWDGECGVFSEPDDFETER